MQRAVGVSVEDHHVRGLLYAALGYTCWGLLSPGNEILLRDYPPLWLQAVRATAALLVLVAWLGPQRLPSAMAILRRPALAAGLALGTFVSFALFIFAQTRIPAAFTTLGFYTSPLWTALIARAWLGEKAGWSFLPAMALLLLGGWLALTGGGSLPAPDPWGVLLAIGAGATWGGYAVAVRRYASGIDWRDLLLASGILGSVLFILTAAVAEPVPDFAAFPARTWTWTAIQVAIPTVAALAFFQAALRDAPAGQVNILVGLELAATLVFAMLLLESRFSGLQWLGMVVALAAVSGYLWLRNRRRGPRRVQSARPNNP